MSASSFPLGESAQKKGGKNLKIERKETLMSGCGQGVFDSGGSSLFSPGYPVLFFSNTSEKALLSSPQMLILGQNSG